MLALLHACAGPQPEAPSPQLNEVTGVASAPSTATWRPEVNRFGTPDHDNSVSSPGSGGTSVGYPTLCDEHQFEGRGESGWTEFVVHPERGSVARVDQQGVLAELELGSFPTALLKQGDHLLVALRSAGEIVRLQVAELSPVDQVYVGAEPTALEGGDDRIWVALQQEHSVVELDGETLEELRRFEVDAQVRWLAYDPDRSTLFAVPSVGNRLTAIDLETTAVSELELPELEVWTPTADATVPGVLRFTGDPDVSETLLVIPGLVVENTTTEIEAPVAYYTTTVPSLPGRFTPVLYIWELDDLDSPPRVVALIGEGVGARSYPSSVLLDGEHAWVPMPGAERIQRVALNDTVTGSDYLDFEVAATEQTQADGGPREVRKLGDGTILWFTRSGQVAWRSDAAWDVEILHAPDNYPEPASCVELEYLDVGRELFQTTVYTPLVQANSGVTCDTCHFEGRTDGLTWPLSSGNRQTPSLAGVTSGTPPYTWTSQVSSVSAEAYMTSAARMGGSGLDYARPKLIANWIDTIPAVRLPDRDPEAVSRGEAVFEDLGCADCHVPPLYTDQTTWEMFEVEVDTPVCSASPRPRPTCTTGAPRPSRTS